MTDDQLFLFGSSDRPKDAEAKPAKDEAARRVIRGVSDFSCPVVLDPVLRLDETIMVRAGAGSGKTTVLVDRMLALVRSGTPIQQIAAITFTKKAAGELQERFFQQLVACRTRITKIVDDPGASHLKEWNHELNFVERALEEAEQIFIGTIHSFCARLLRARSLDLGIPPEFEQIDERDEEILRLRFWNRFLHESSVENDPDLAILQDAEVSFEALMDLFGTLASNASVQFPISNSQKPKVETVFGSLVQYIEAIESRIPPMDPDNLVTEMGRMAAMIKAYDTSDEYVQMKVLKTAANLVKGTEKPEINLGVQSWGTAKSAPGSFARALKKGEEDLGLSQPFLEFLLDVVMPLAQEWDHWLHDVALHFASHSVERYRRYRLVEGKLTYDDLLAEALTLLREISAARSFFRGKYQHVLVDEFQDTDPIQAAMLFTLAAESLDRDDWSKSRLSPGFLFLVGDDKQSIYRFRKADFQAFHLVAQSITDQGGLDLNLETNFRSDERICRWVNEAVGPLFQAPSFPYQAPWEDLSAYKGEFEFSAPIVHMIVEKSPIASHYPKINAECAAIISHIRNVRSSPESAGLDYSRFLILVKRHAVIPRYVEALTAAGIPIGVTGGKAEEISGVLALLDDLFSALYNMHDEVSLVATLRSSIFGVSDQDLFSYSRTGRSPSHLWVEPDGSEGLPRLKMAGALLRTLKDVELSLPPYRAVEQILAKSGIEAMLSAQADSDLSSGMLQRVLELFREWETMGYTFGQCVEEFKLYRNGDLKLDSFSEQLPFGTCVQIMTTHQAKGLQADVVILADTGGRKPPDATLHIHREGPVVFGKTPLKKNNGFNDVVELEPKGWTEALEIESQFNRAEQYRLLYVACTRARKQLVIFTNQSQSTGPWDDLLPYLSSGNGSSITVSPIMDLDVWMADNTLPHTLEDGPQQPVAWSAKLVQQRIDRLSEPSWQVERPSEAEDLEQPVYGSGLGLEYGSAIHSLMESLVSKRKESLPIEEVAEWAKHVMNERLTRLGLESLVPVSVQAALSFYRSDIWTEIAGASRVLTEVPFTLTRQVDHVERVVSGVVDLAYRTPSGWKIIDYKTDQATEHDLRLRHRDQITTYLQAWEQIFPDESCTALIWSTHLSKGITL